MTVDSNQFYTNLFIMKYNRIIKPQALPLTDDRTYTISASCEDVSVDPSLIIDMNGLAFIFAFSPVRIVSAIEDINI
jgi:hypothetical protein